MNRREALFHTAAILGGTITGAQVFLSGCTTQKEPVTDTVTTDFLDEVAEVILPATSESGGAKAAGVGAFMKTIVADCYDEAEETKFWSGIKAIDQEAEKEYAIGFLRLDDQQKFDLIAAIDREARHADGHYFRMIKELTIWGYFSSETGCREALRFNPIPGRYEACIPYNNEPDWAG